MSYINLSRSTNNSETDPHVSELINQFEDLVDGWGSDWRHFCDRFELDSMERDQLYSLMIGRLEQIPVSLPPPENDADRINQPRIDSHK